jgi:hypothetical protein
MAWPRRPLELGHESRDAAVSSTSPTPCSCTSLPRHPHPHTQTHSNHSLPNPYLLSAPPHHPSYSMLLRGATSSTTPHLRIPDACFGTLTTLTRSSNPALRNPHLSCFHSWREMGGTGAETGSWLFHREARHTQGSEERKTRGQRASVACGHGSC